MTPQKLRALVKEQLSSMQNASVADAIRVLLVEPYSVSRPWDYGEPGQHFDCWTVLEHPTSATGVAYCERGFGPKCPWGLVWLEGEHMSMGMDSSWFPSLEEAFRDSMAWED